MDTLGTGVPPELLGIGAGWLIVGLFVIGMMRGNLVPRRTYDDVIHDRDEWRAAHRISETARATAVHQVEELLEHARTTDEFIRSLPHPSRESQ